MIFFLGHPNLHTGIMPRLRQGLKTVESREKAKKKSNNTIKNWKKKVNLKTETNH